MVEAIASASHVQKGASSDTLSPELWSVIARRALAAEDDSVQAWARLSRVSRNFRDAIAGDCAPSDCGAAPQRYEHELRSRPSSACCASVHLRLFTCANHHAIGNGSSGVSTPPPLGKVPLSSLGVKSIQTTVEQ